MHEIDFLEYKNQSLIEIIYNYISLKSTRNIRILLIDVEIIIEEFLCFFNLNKEEFKLTVHTSHNNLLFDINNNYTRDIMNKKIIIIMRELKFKYLLD